MNTRFVLLVCALFIAVFLSGCLNPPSIVQVEASVFSIVATNNPEVLNVDFVVLKPVTDLTGYEEQSGVDPTGGHYATTFLMSSLTGKGVGDVLYLVCRTDRYYLLLQDSCVLIPQ
jgi:hypothetical protein